MHFSNLPLLSVRDDLEDWLDDNGPDIAVTLAVLVVAYLIFQLVFPRVARAAIIRGGHPSDQEAERRANTIIHVIQRTAGFAFLIIGAITILPEFGVDITALVAGLGITGLALALGAQTLVRDGINGIFLLAEDQYRTGDVVRIANVTGTVEAITLRRTIIRDRDGVVHSVPNGAIDVVSNFTRDFATVNLPVQVAYGEDLARVGEVIERVGKEMSSQEPYASLLIGPPRAGGVEAVGPEGVTLMVTAAAKPAARWDVTVELRRRLTEAFLAEGIRVPFGTVGPSAPP
jgi:small conductance mechanosensitive channel